MSRPLQANDYVVASFDSQSATFIVRATEPNIVISPLSELDKQYNLYNIPVNWMIQGMPPLQTISFVAREEVSQLAFTNIPEIDIKILGNLDDEQLKNTCQTNRYAAGLCLADILWKSRVEKYYPDRVKDKDKYNLFNFTWKDYYYYLKVCDIGFYFVYFIHTDTIRYSNVAFAFRNFEDAINNIMSEAGSSIEDAFKRGEYGDKSKEEVERETRSKLIENGRIEPFDIYGFRRMKVFPQMTFLEELPEEMPQPSFTGNLETDMQILNEMNDQNLKTICESDRYAMNLCSNEDFWRQRIEKYYPGRANQKDIVAQAYSFFNFTWQDYYKYLMFFGRFIYVNAYVDKDYNISMSVFQNKEDASKSAQNDVRELIGKGLPLDPNSSFEEVDYDEAEYVEFTDRSAYLLSRAQVNPVITK